MKTKTFDCVKMKNDIQKKLLEEYAGLTPEQQRELSTKRIEADPVLGPLWQKLRRDSKSNDNGKKHSPN